MSFRFYTAGRVGQAVSQAFLRGWYHCADQFLAAGYCDPQRYFVVLDRLGINGDFMPDRLRASLLGWVGACGQLGHECTESLLSCGLRYDGIAASADDIKDCIYAWGTHVGVEEFAQQLWEHGMRVILHRGMDAILNDVRPIGETARKLLEAVA